MSRAIPYSIIILLLSLFMTANSALAYNTSVCGFVEINSLFYFINEAQSNEDIIETYFDKNTNTNFTLFYNLCYQLQYWCQNFNNIVIGSMVAIDPAGNCQPFNQTSIQLINITNASQGLSVTYLPIPITQTINSSLISLTQITKSYYCNGIASIGCPEVTQTSIWAYFSSNTIVYTIVIEAIGVIFMVLGVYIYRVTLILLGATTAFLILMVIEQFVVFVPGVPETDLSSIMIITIICCFFVGYVLTYFPKAGLFCMGMWIGLIITLTINNIFLYLILSNPQSLPLYIILPILCVGFGILTVCVKTKFIVFATSLIGAYICLRALSWHLGDFPNEMLYPQQYRLGLVGTVTWQFYLYVIALLILTASSSALQFWLFKKKLQRTNETGDIDEHLNKMQNSLQNERQNFIEFENIFKKLRPEEKKPRVLKREENTDDEYELKTKNKRNSYSKESMSFEQNEQEEENGQEDESDEQQQTKKKQQLKEKLLKKDVKKKR